MIRINLLPPELRRTEVTPLGQQLAIFGGVALACLLLVWMGFLFVRIYQLNAEKGNLAQQLKDQLTLAGSLLAEAGFQSPPQLTAVQGKFSELKTKIANLQTLMEARELVAKTRPVQWSIKVDQLCDIISDSPSIWLQTLSVKRDAAAGPVPLRPGMPATGPPTAYTLTLKCLSAGPQLENITDFRLRLRKSEEFWRDFSDAMDKFEYQTRKAAETREGVALEFKLGLKILAEPPKPPTPKVGE